MTREATWANVGTDVRNSKSIKDVLKEAHLDFKVSKRDIFSEVDGKRIYIPNQVATVREDTNEVLGIVSKGYEVCQNEEAFDFVNYISEDLEYAKAGMTRGGLVYVISRLPEVKIVDDSFRPYIIFQNGHNGGISIKAAICPLRIVCQNQFNIAFKEANNTISIRHSVSMSSKLEDAKELIKSSANYMNVLSRRAEILVNNKVSVNTFNKLLEKLFPIREDMSERSKNSIIRNRESLIAAYENEDNQNYKGTAWGICNAYTDYITHNEGHRNTKNRDESKFVNVTFNSNPTTRLIEMLESIA